MHTSVGILALAGFLVAPSPVPETLWMSDYGAAQRKGTELQKPLAVVIASGHNGFERLLKEGNLSHEARSTLGKNYVCVYVDASRLENRGLVKTFGFRSEVALVLSTRKGDYQAFSHDGPLPESDLLNQLRRHAPVAALMPVAPITPAKATYVVYVDGKFIPADQYSPPRSDIMRTVQPSSFSQGRTVQNC